MQGWWDNPTSSTVATVLYWPLTSGLSVGLRRSDWCSGGNAEADESGGQNYRNVERSRISDSEELRNIVQAFGDEALKLLYPDFQESLLKVDL